MKKICSSSGMEYYPINLNNSSNHWAKNTLSSTKKKCNKYSLLFSFFMLLFFQTKENTHGIITVALFCSKDMAETPRFWRICKYSNRTGSSCHKRKNLCFRGHQVIQNLTYITFLYHIFFMEKCEKIFRLVIFPF